jgi:hypothetical protein
MMQTKRVATWVEQLLPCGGVLGPEKCKENGLIVYDDIFAQKTVVSAGKM